MLISLVGLGTPALCTQRVDGTTNLCESRVSRWQVHDCHCVVVCKWMKRSRDTSVCGIVFLFRNHLWTREKGFGVPTTVGCVSLLVKLTVSRC